ncbi:MAG: MBL fold metallo-hydrolase [Gammaproteobacteria bacterium]|nr:MBL fold metallo-hydrolase [Gammaproteobacteria bacterium]
MKRIFPIALALAVTSACAQEAEEPAPASEEPLNLEQLLERFNWDLDAVEITTEQVGERLYVLFGAGGNIAVSVGEQGVLVVDDMFPEVIPKVEAAIREIGGEGADGKIDFAINTHWHFDHAEGDLALGPGGTWIAAHANSAAMMAKENILNMVITQYRQPPYPPAARPAIVYDDRMRFDFNGEEIDLVHAGPAHTAGDTAVIFKGHNAVHFGDVFNNTGYPFIDVDSGGGINGMIAFCQAILDEIGPDAIVIPGHGPVTDSATLQAYIDMLTTVRDRVAAQMAEGKSLMAVVASNVTNDLEERYGPVTNSLGFVDRVYTSLQRDAE